jgi:hypothetical protein
MLIFFKLQKIQMPLNALVTDDSTSGDEIGVQSSGNSKIKS